MMQPLSASPLSSAAILSRAGLRKCATSCHTSCSAKGDVSRRALFSPRRGGCGASAMTGRATRRPVCAPTELASLRGHVGQHVRRPSRGQRRARHFSHGILGALGASGLRRGASRHGRILSAERLHEGSGLQRCGDGDVHGRSALRLACHP